MRRPLAEIILLLFSAAILFVATLTLIAFVRLPM